MREISIDGIVIGNTCIDIALNRPSEDDLDLFVTSMSPLLEEDRIRNIAYQRGWSTGSTDLGTPSITMNIDGVDITIELYENILDFYIPNEALNICRRSIDIDGNIINYIAPECWLVFKARRGANKDLSELMLFKQIAEEEKMSIDRNLIEKVIELYEEDRHYIIDRLKSIKIL